MFHTVERGREWEGERARKRESEREVERKITKKKE